MKIKAGIVGAAGFAGAELTRLLLRHPSFELCAITSDALAGRALAEVYPAFAGASDLVFSKHDKSVLAPTSTWPFSPSLTRRPSR